MALDRILEFFMPPSSPFLFERWRTLVLGADSFQQLRIQRTLIAGLIYAASAVLIIGSIYAKKTAWSSGCIVLAYEAIGSFTFLLLIRMGMNLRFSDPSLTLPQLLHGLGAAVLFYFWIPVGRSLTLPSLSLALTFALLSRLTPRQTLYCGLTATAMLFVAFLISLWRGNSTMNVTQEAINLIMAGLTLPIFSMVSKQAKEWRDQLKKQRAQLLKLADELRERALRDELTGLVNRGAMNAAILEEFLRFERHRRNFCVAILDVDNFKQVNDLFGHYEGDSVLVALSRHLTQHFSQPDQVSRWGGEEFVILAPESTLSAIVEALDEARRSFVCSAGMATDSPRKITFSVGVAQCHADDDPSILLARADMALYAAKRQGRNRVVAA
jgi:diguanylate cyclase (GGDEF)-like protein